MPKGIRNQMRLIIFIIIGYLGYVLYKSWFSNSKKEIKSSTKTDNTLVLDPYCGVYHSKSNAVIAKFKGEKLYFCSKECRDKFFKKNK